MNFFNYKFLLSISVLALSLFAVSFFTGKETNNVNQYHAEDTSYPKNEISADAVLSDDTHHDQFDAEDDAPRQTITDQHATVSDDYTRIVKEFEHRRKSLGSFDLSELEAYETYDDNTLLALGESGDLIAAEVMLERAILYGHDETTFTFEQALDMSVNLGSTSSIVRKGDRVLRSANSAYDKGEINAEQLRAEQIESMAHYEVAMIRGTDLGFEAGVQLQHQLATGDHFNNAELQAISSRAGEIISGINAWRSERGFGEMENFDLVMSRYSKENIEKLFAHAYPNGESSWGLDLVLGDSK